VFWKNLFQIDDYGTLRKSAHQEEAKLISFLDFL